MDSACLEMQENVFLKLWVKLGCSPRCSQMVPKWHLDRQVAGSYFFNTRVRRDAQTRFRFRRERVWLDSACLEMQENVCLKLWVKTGCSPRCSQMVPKWHLDGQVLGTDFFNTRARRDAQKSFHRERVWVDSTCLEMQQNVCWNLSVKLGFSRCTQMVPQWHLDRQMAGSYFLNTCAQCNVQKSFRFRRERVWVDSACLQMQENMCV